MPDLYAAGSDAPASPLATPQGCSAEGGRHYVVTSPWRVYYSMVGEPPGGGCCLAEVVAPTKRAAAVAACRTREFADWVTEARGDGVPPFEGLEVELMQCEHGVCWGCLTDELDGCPACIAQDEAARHHPIGWDGGRPLDCEECGESWPCSARCQRCDGNGQVWDPTVFGNVGACLHCGGSGDAGAPSATHVESGRSSQ